MTTPTPGAPPGGRTARRAAGGKARDLHLNIGKDKRGAGGGGKGGRPDVLEDSGIGLDDHLPPVEPTTCTTTTTSPHKVLATPPIGKRKNLATSPHSAPAGTGPPRSFTAAMTGEHARKQTHSHSKSKLHPQTNSPTSFSLLSGSPPRSSSPGFAHMIKETVHRTFSGSSTSSMTSSSAVSASGSTTTSGASSKHAHTASFQLGGSDSEEESTTSGGSGSSSRRSSQKATPSGGRESKGKGRFRRMLNPLRRSHSAGCSQDVPAHALFLKQEAEKKKLSSSQKSVDKSTSSLGADRTGSDSEGDDADRKSGKSKKKSLARDLKDKMAFLRRRHTDTALASKMADGKTQRPTAETVASWNREFDNLLLDKVGLEMFRDFLQSEFSDENLEFWIACQEYKNLKDNKLAAHAQKIYIDFVAVQAPREINLDSKTRMACHNAMSSPNKHTFELAQKRIQALMEKDSYPRFLKSESYQELCSELKLNT